MTTALIEGKNKEMQSKAISLLLQSNVIKSIMSIAGYKESYINCHWKEWGERWLRNVNFDEKAVALKGKTILLQDFVSSKAFEWATKDDPKWAAVAAKVSGDMGKIHLEEKTPTSLHFTFQTVQQNVDNSGPKSVRENDNDVDNSQLIDITEESE